MMRRRKAFLKNILQPGELLIRSADVSVFGGEENLPKLNISFSLHLVSCVQKVITNTLVPQAMSKKCDRGRHMSQEYLLLVNLE